ncbi:RNA polymerase [Dacryopinax primogenitus]|uniref:DNA-directed RNA polymerases I, II, and III subunit RPABC3 n=1 Tax=Dacryopinax primogenitus (strain DJM 731) TaxID=1858805 RepID=M5GCS6_DACPD|nr:RNA polymerase [Dacryopinax primogenitus]EJU01948.1 RNA polymerase [Dacryopinax primogenitus]
MATLPLLASAHSAVTFEDVFTIHSLDPEGKKYDRVSRLFARSHAFDMDLVLDFHCEIFPLREGETVTVVLAKSLQKGLYEEPEEKKELASWRVDGPVGLEEYFDYVCYGKVYRFDEGVGEKVTAYISFGGLLMTLSGSYRNMGTVTVGAYTYLLVRRTLLT